MRIESPVFGHNQSIPEKYTCDGQNINPALKISGVPENAKSLALIVDDPDATRGITWIHWVILNIGGEKLENGRLEITENNVPTGSLELKTSFGKPGYGGPCPPPNQDKSIGKGTHRYFFKLYALDTEKINSVEEIPAHTIASAELIGLYNRK
ncbi:hypothetical protein A3I36_00240 [Candidatus Giovannonibacteria bacterium RIFCSPLOWO2_02_FULL_45_28]|uniref:YbhB/YbcL family Raf kinase inhibitor-like protein n=2 Tax=Candidatus Giovannoniibacteriota TaxID=1752738 RepID=A0A1F5WAU0_9BACT|nr:MAG: Phospholipid-binding protein, PBP family [Parcubacteria group bacterium GW2011_GWC1_44_10]KKT59262.1 MAG: Phospholipid-binding protein, PBP family [Candidatus Giovannonibacteria bacterium GW2011_GWA1_44_25]KKU29558.1 MAG: Phospholipid-binding protein, PBP family [Candidatus Giovannonibacteria bacterium GW2011_GWB1_46_20]OGF49236.1 MAG: hypothetical protein A2120_04140 [Candidatus Giovannonibacteria bacterium GWA2_45_15]OGF59526.1 MAG: hypothetical protein A2W40_02775 [Candidatus Giovann